MKNAILAGLLCSLAISPLMVSAETATSAEKKIVPMETMTITYRSPLDYALYQYTIELLTQFRMEINSSIHTQAQISTQEMYEDFTASLDMNLPEVAAVIDANNSAPK
ncbi:hypothetical protein LZP69_07490 [Shewanella sp. AS1]|uniref:hypothetical protein n=1 Tax=Shewanella sp. AS1 TaxID=2907626 RepID=UPI001F471F96|nr:hypothetical protein [Shewanella sp. AS1]MCE9679028.1 hypothetical protein [Shewanella sp. AS1]